MQLTNLPLFTAVSLVTGNAAHSVAIHLPSWNRYHSATLDIQPLILTAFKLLFIFTALHWMQEGLVARKVSVRPSVCQTNGLTKRKKPVQVFIPYEKSF